MDSENTQDQTLKSDALAIFQAALEAADPYKAVTQAISLEDETLKVRRGRKVIKSVNLGRVENIYIVGGGKASAPMAKALEDILGERLTEGLICVKYGHTVDLARTTTFEAAHPLPDLNGVKAASQIKALLERTTARDLVFSVISGGGSALLPLPSPGIKLSEKQDVTRLLLGSGADIHEINVVRKHLSQLKGGQMATLAAPSTTINLMLSDVVGDDMDTIASGPFVPDSSTFDDVTFILARYKLMKKVPSSVRTHLKQGLTGEAPDTPKPEDAAFSKVTNLIVGSNSISLAAASDEAKQLGYKPLLLSSTMVGETSEVARVHVAMAREVRASGNPAKPPCCLISGGETTVTLSTEGQGGRNQEFALAAALDMAGLENTLIFSAGTDGTDGPTDAAGAMADGQTLERAAQLGVNAKTHLFNHDSYPFFKALGDLVKTGPTLTNVMDVRLVLVR